MSRYDIRGMQASGMTQQQINDLIKRKDAEIYGPRGMDPKGYDVKPQVMPPVKPRPIRTATGTPIKPVKGQQVGSMPPVKKGLLGGINPNAKPPAGIDVEKIRQGVQSLPKGIMDDDFVPKTPPSNIPFGQRLQGMMQSFGQLGQNKAAMMKKGGEAKKYTKGGKINLDACSVSTAQKSKSSPKW